MGMKRVYVDGYNVINSWNELKKCTLAIAREKLKEYMIDYASFYDCDVVIVYDAHRISGNSEHIEILNKLTIVYTKDGETADSYIERSVDILNKRIEVLVVTSDNLEQQIIFGRGAQRMSSKEFELEFFKAKEAIVKEIENVSINKANKLSDLIDEKSLKIFEDFRRN